MKAVMVLCSACKQHRHTQGYLQNRQGTAPAPLKHGMVPRAACARSKQGENPSFPFSWHLRHPRHFPCSGGTPNSPCGTQPRGNSLLLQPPWSPSSPLTDSASRTPQEFVKPCLVWLPRGGGSPVAPEQQQQGKQTLKNLNKCDCPYWHVRICQD